MNIPKEEMEFAKEIYHKITDYADEKKDYGITVRICVALIRASIKYFTKRGNYIELGKIALRITELFDEINEIDFPEEF